MKIGYPCLNYSLQGFSNQTFRLASFSQERFIATLENNLDYLKRVLQFNVQHGLLFFRISSDIIPFASHPILNVPWQNVFKSQLQDIGKYIRQHEIRISMHPDQFVLINSPRTEVVEASFRDLEWHCQFLDLLGLDQSAKVQIHVGGVYGERKTAIRDFIANYLKLSPQIRNRLVIEHDDRCFPLNDCLKIHEAVGVPVVFDNLHHECLNQGETLFEALSLAQSTWEDKDGVMMLDYSIQQSGAIRGKHANSIDRKEFTDFLLNTVEIDFDLMLEIKDKEKSALEALKIYKNLQMELIA